MSINIPSKLEKTIFVCLGVGKYTLGKLTICSHDLSTDCLEFGYIQLCKKDLVIDIPDIDFNAKLIASMERLKDKELFKNSITLDSLEAQINLVQSTLAIEGENDAT